MLVLFIFIFFIDWTIMRILILFLFRPPTLEFWNFSRKSEN